MAWCCFHSLAGWPVYNAEQFGHELFMIQVLSTITVQEYTQYYVYGRLAWVEHKQSKLVTINVNHELIVTDCMYIQHTTLWPQDDLVSCNALAAWKSTSCLLIYNLSHSILLARGCNTLFGMLTPTFIRVIQRIQPRGNLPASKLSPNG